MRERYLELTLLLVVNDIHADSTCAADGYAR
jgi:hypothetical protein